GRRCPPARRLDEAGRLRARCWRKETLNSEPVGERRGPAFLHAKGRRAEQPSAFSSVPPPTPRSTPATSFQPRSTVTPNVRNCRDPRFRLSQITWRTGVAHHPTEDSARCTVPDALIPVNPVFGVLRS